MKLWNLLRFWWKQPDSEAAACLIIDLAGQLDPRDVRELEDYFKALREFYERPKP